MKHSIFSQLAEHWPSPLVAREEVAKFSGGILNPRTLANLDALDQGPKGRIRIGRKVAYPVSELIAWMEKRSQALD